MMILMHYMFLDLFQRTEYIDEMVAGEKIRRKTYFEGLKHILNKGYCSTKFRIELEDDSH